MTTRRIPVIAAVSDRLPARSRAARVSNERSRFARSVYEKEKTLAWPKNFDETEALEKAMQAFWVHGYGATSMQALVECTGVNRGSLYATNDDNRSLFLAALRMYDSTMRHGLLAESEVSNAPRDAIRALFLAFMADARDGSSNRGCFLINTLSDVQT